MQIIPTQPLANQQLQVQLGGQAVTLNIYQNTYGMFTDVYVGAALIVAGVICQNMNRIVRDLYLGFVGDLAWLDVTGNATNPVYTGLGSQYQLMYLTPADLTAKGVVG